MLGFAWLIGFWAAGEGMEHGLNIPLPGNVIGMLMLLAALRLGWVKLEWMKDAAQLLLSHMMLFFAPIVVGTMVYADVILGHPLAIGSAVTAGTLFVLVAGGWSAFVLEKKRVKGTDVHG
ncbi:CidA/LrgA family protein [Paenibacillus sp. 1P07SE]|uniref:CidA/LrgA family protein n=1 Tax=Paenibacillus sp. 1P07SE TaxID=3132209 RepID=UPI0039A44A2B